MWLLHCCTKSADVKHHVSQFVRYYFSIGQTTLPMCCQSTRDNAVVGNISPFQNVPGQAALAGRCPANSAVVPPPAAGWPPSPSSAPTWDRPWSCWSPPSCSRLWPCSPSSPSPRWNTPPPTLALTETETVEEQLPHSSSAGTQSAWLRCCPVGLDSLESHLNRRFKVRCQYKCLCFRRAEWLSAFIPSSQPIRMYSGSERGAVCRHIPNQCQQDVELCENKKCQCGKKY